MIYFFGVVKYGYYDYEASLLKIHKFGTYAVSKRWFITISETSSNSKARFATGGMPEADSTVTVVFLGIVVVYTNREK